MSRNRGLLPLAGVAFCSAQIWQVPYQRHQFIISRRQEKHHSRQQESPSGEILVPDLTTPHRIMRTWVILWHFSLWINWLIYQNNVATAIFNLCSLFKRTTGQTFKMPVASWVDSFSTLIVCPTSSKFAVPTRTFCSCLFSVTAEVLQHVNDLISILL